MADTVRVLFFATAREATGQRFVESPVSPQGIPVHQLLDELGSRYPALEAILRSSRIVLNGQYLTSLRGRVRPGDELAVHPPYSGG
jgi:molybdopterin converting factor small subunit